MGERLNRHIGTIALFLLFLIMFFISSGCVNQNDEQTSPVQQQHEQSPLPADDSNNQAPVINEPEPEVKSYTTSANLLAVGDIMMHNTQIKAGYDTETKSYKYDSFFNEVKGILSTGDWVIGNLETPTAGEDLKFTGYPMFNAPTEIIDACKNAGFNILTNANNHTLDRGEKGVIRTRESLLDRGLATQGTARSNDEADEILMLTKNDIKMAILAYTYGTNGIPVPKGKEYLVSLINEEKILKDIKEARNHGADVVTVSLHFGVEYQREPNQEQIQLVHKLIGAGADIILGSHPHVVQPYQEVEVKGDDGLIRKGVAIYSMGNFISAQEGEYKNLGLIFGVNIQKNFPEGNILIDKITAIPTWVQSYKENGKTKYRVLPIEQTINIKNDKLLSSKDYQNLEGYLKKMNAHVSSMDIAVISQP